MNPQRPSIGVFRLSRLIPSLIVILFAGGLGLVPAADKGVALASTGTLAMSNVTLNNSHVPRFETVEYTFRMAGQWENPFNPVKSAWMQ